MHLLLGIVVGGALAFVGMGLWIGYLERDSLRE